MFWFPVCLSRQHNWSHRVFVHSFWRHYPARVSHSWCALPRSPLKCTKFHVYPKHSRQLPSWWGILIHRVDRSRKRSEVVFVRLWHRLHWCSVYMGERRGFGYIVCYSKHDLSIYLVNQWFMTRKGPVFKLVRRQWRKERFSEVTV